MTVKQVPGQVAFSVFRMDAEKHNGVTALSAHASLSRTPLQLPRSCLGSGVVVLLLALLLLEMLVVVLDDVLVVSIVVLAGVVSVVVVLDISFAHVTGSQSPHAPSPS